MSHVIHVMIFDIIRSVLIDITNRNSKYDGIYSLQTGKFYESKERRKKSLTIKRNICVVH